MKSYFLGFLTSCVYAGSCSNKWGRSSYKVQGSRFLLAQTTKCGLEQNRNNTEKLTYLQEN